MMMGNDLFDILSPNTMGYSLGVPFGISMGFEIGGVGLVTVLTVSVSVSLSPARMRSIIAL